MAQAHQLPWKGSQSIDALACFEETASNISMYKSPVLVDVGASEPFWWAQVTMVPCWDCALKLTL